MGSNPTPSASLLRRNNSLHPTRFLTLALITMTSGSRVSAIPQSRKANASDVGFTPSELRSFRALKTPAGIQRYLDNMPYHLAGTAWSPRMVLREATAHCLEGAVFAAAALRVLGFPPLIFDLEADQRYRPRCRDFQIAWTLGRRRQIQFHRVPLSGAGLSHPARAGA